MGRQQWEGPSVEYIYMSPEVGVECKWGLEEGGILNKRLSSKLQPLGGGIGYSGSIRQTKVACKQHVDKPNHMTSTWI